MNTDDSLEKAKEIVLDDELRKAKLQAAPKKQVPRAVGVPIPPRCVLKCRNRSEVVIVSESGNMLFLCKADAYILQTTGNIPQNKIPESKKVKK